MTEPKHGWMIVLRNIRNWQERLAMRLTFVGKDPDSNPTGSPTVYRTDRNTWVVQGWTVTDPQAISQMDIPEGETAVEIPDRIVHYLTQHA